MKIGAACKWLNNRGETMPQKNFRITTVKRLLEKTKEEQHESLLEILDHNLSALQLVIIALSNRPEQVRMWRIGSDLLPLYTHYGTASFYRDKDVQTRLQAGLLTVGELARKHDIRLSFHPGQFIVIGSVHPHVREQSRIELEYHADCARMMGYTSWHQDGFCINVHVGGKQADPKVVRAEIKAMSPVLRNLLTLENDEFCWSAQNIVEQFGDLVPCVLDVHHYWISEGEQLSANNLLVENIINTWQGARPKLHLAMSHRELVPVFYQNKNIPLQVLLNTGLTRGKLRVHSQSPWHLPTLDYVRSFIKDFDVMWEGKDKNVGQRSIARYFDVI